MQSVISNSSKILIDVEGGNNMMYLPLDKIINSSGLSTAKGGNIGERQLEELTNQVVEKINERRSTTRIREGR